MLRWETPFGNYPGYRSCWVLQDVFHLSINYKLLCLKKWYVSCKTDTVTIHIYQVTYFCYVQICP